MDFSKRNSRLIIVIGGVGLTGYIYRLLEKFIVSSYSTIVLTGIPFSITQFLSSFLLASFIGLITLAGLYLYNELYDYSNLSETNKIKFLKRADIFYLSILRFLFYSGMFIILFMIIFTFFQSYLSSVLLLMIESLSYIYILFIIITLFKIGKIKNVILRFIKSIKHRISESWIFIIIGAPQVWILSFLVSAILGINSNTSSSMVLEFKSEDELLLIKYSDNIPDYLPEEISVDFYEDTSLIGSKKISRDDFKMTYVQTLSHSNNKHSIENEIVSNVISKSKYNFYSELKLLEAQRIEEGKIHIHFEVEKFFDHGEINIINYFYKQEDLIRYKEEKIEIDL